MRLKLLFAALALFLSGLLACTAAAPHAGFIENPVLLEEDPDLPFNEVWLKEGVDLSAYDTVYVAPVDVSHLLEMSWWQNASLAQAFRGTKPEAATAALAERFRKKVIEAFENDPIHPYTVVETPEKDSLGVELALVEVVPTKVWLNAISYIAVGALDTGTTAMEGRFRDNTTGEIIGEFKDRRKGQYSLVSIADLRWYGHANHTLSQWANEIVKICRREPNERVARAKPVTLRPW